MSITINVPAEILIFSLKCLSMSLNIDSLWWTDTFFVMCIFLQLDFGIPHESIFHLINAQVCERSLGNTQNGPSMPHVQNFVRAEMLPSGYLIRPCEGGGSIVHIVDHMNLGVKGSSIIS